jgi:hypothetical protein
MTGPPEFDWPYGEHGTAVGTTGSGKTFMVKNAILPWKKRFIVVDSKAREDGTSIDFTEKAFVKCDVERAVKIAAGDKNFRLRIPIQLGEEGYAQIEDLSEGLLKQNGHDCLVYLDEVTDLSDAWAIGPMLEGLVRKGRGYKISVVVGSQKPKGVNGWFVDNSAHVYIFGMKQAEVTRFVRNTGAEWVATVQPKIPIGSYKFAHENWQGEVTVFEPVKEYDWAGVE